MRACSDRISGAVSTVSVLCACGPEFAVIPQGGVRQLTASTSGVMVTAFADQWEADPRDLADYVTPIAVDLYNGTGVEVRVSLADFSLGGADGMRTPAVNPFSIPYAAAPGEDRGSVRCSPVRSSLER